MNLSCVDQRVAFIREEKGEKKWIFFFFPFFFSSSNFSLWINFDSNCVCRWLRLCVVTRRIVVSCYDFFYFLLKICEGNYRKRNWLEEWPGVGRATWHAAQAATAAAEAAAAKRLLLGPWPERKSQEVNCLFDLLPLIQAATTLWFEKEWMSQADAILFLLLPHFFFFFLNKINK